MNTYKVIAELAGQEVSFIYKAETKSKAYARFIVLNPCNLDKVSITKIRESIKWFTLILD